MDISAWFRDPVATATLVLAFVTLILAIAAFWTIYQNYEFRKKDRKERLLNEIIEWAANVVAISCNMPFDLQSVGIVGTSLERTSHYATLYNYVSGLQARRGESQKIMSIASSKTLQKNKSLNTSVNTLIASVEAH